MDINEIKLAAKQRFAEYASHYDMSDPKISLKAAHTYRVAEYCEEIGISIGLQDEELLVAWMCGMLHDIGRFEQVTRYGTFIDAKSVDHAHLSCEILWGEENDGKNGIIREFMPSEEYDELIRTAIYWHSAFRYPSEINGKTKLYCDLLRDADKLDIWRVNLETPLSDIHNVPMEEFYISDITPEVEQSFYNHSCVLRTLKKTAVDNVVGYLSLYWELTYERSKEIAREQGYLRKLAEFESKNPTTKEKFKRMAEELGL